MNLKKKESEIVTESYNDVMRNLVIIITLACAFAVFIFMIISMSIKCAEDIQSDYTFEVVSIKNASYGKVTRVVYDKETKVMYSMSSYGELSPLINADGTPRLYGEDE